MFVRRAPGSTHLLEWRVVMFTLGAGLGLGGMYLNLPWMVSLAIAVLLIGFLLRYAGAPDSESGSPVAPDSTGSDDLDAAEPEKLEDAENA